MDWCSRTSTTTPTISTLDFHLFLFYFHTVLTWFLLLSAAILSSMGCARSCRTFRGESAQTCTVWSVHREGQGWAVHSCPTHRSDQLRKLGKEKLFAVLVTPVLVPFVCICNQSLSFWNKEGSVSRKGLKKTFLFWKDGNMTLCELSLVMQTVWGSCQRFPTPRRQRPAMEKLAHIKALQHTTADQVVAHFLSVWRGHTSVCFNISSDMESASFIVLSKPTHFSDRNKDIFKQAPWSLFEDDSSDVRLFFFSSAQYSAIDRRHQAEIWVTTRHKRRRKMRKLVISWTGSDWMFSFLKTSVMNDAL